MISSEIEKMLSPIISIKPISNVCGGEGGAGGMLCVELSDLSVELFLTEILCFYIKCFCQSMHASSITLCSTNVWVYNVNIDIYV